MFLAIDAGNTNVVFAIFDGERLVCRWRTSTDVKRTADEYAVWLTQLMALEQIKAEDIKGVIMASVVPQTMYALSTLAERYFRREPVIVNHQSDLGISIHIDNPREVGADRLVNAVAAHDSSDGWLIIIDFGTATTLDVISDRGHYEGGVIAPGVNLSLEALDRAAAKLPRIAIEQPETVIGKGTVTAMLSGVYWGYVGLIEGLVGRIKKEIGEPAKVIATGGLASLFSGATDAIDEVDDELTLRGLRLIYQRSRKEFAGNDG